MNHDFKTDTVQLVVRLKCPACYAHSYIGSEFPAERMQENNWGLFGHMKGNETNMVHCPLCDHTIDNGDYDLSAHIEDVTP